MNEEAMKPPVRTSRKGRSGRFVMSTRMPVMVWEMMKRRIVRGILQMTGTGSCQNRLKDMYPATTSMSVVLEAKNIRLRA